MADESNKPAEVEVEEKKEESTPAPEVQKEADKPIENGESTEAKATEEEKPEEGKTDGEAAGAEGAADDKPSETPAENPLEAPKENPFVEEDFEKLLSYADSNEEGWEKMKNKHKGLSCFKRTDKSEKNGMPIIKGIIDLPNVSFDRAVELFTDLDERKKWNKKIVSEVLETKEDFRIMYTTIKLPPPYTNRDMVQCAASKKSDDPKQSVYVFKACNHPTKPANKSTITRAELMYGGLIVKPGEDENASQVILVNQINMKGWIPKAILHKMNNSYPSSVYDDLSSFLKKAAAAAEKEAAAAAAAEAAAAAAAEKEKEEAEKAEAAKNGEKKEEEAAAEPEKKAEEEEKKDTPEVNGEKEEEAKTEETPKAETNGETEEKKEEKTEEAEAAAEPKEAS
ncbi:uncharacterized protein [Antedon mediterranea]|uniref:uncharacterized protein n=1 Tax=Antedon mediterranea TaxID=105859 RepID=UPI003AF9454E